MQENYYVIDNRVSYKPHKNLIIGDSEIWDTLKKQGYVIIYMGFDCKNCDFENFDIALKKGKKQPQKLYCPNCETISLINTRRW